MRTPSRSASARPAATRMTLTSDSAATSSSCRAIEPLHSTSAGLRVGGGLAEVAVVDLGRVEIVVPDLDLGVERAKVLEQDVGAGGVGGGIDDDAALLLGGGNDRLVIRGIAGRDRLRENANGGAEQQCRREREALHGCFSLGRDVVWCYVLGPHRSCARPCGRVHPSLDGTADPLRRFRTWRKRRRSSPNTRPPCATRTSPAMSPNAPGRASRTPSRPSSADTTCPGAASSSPSRRDTAPAARAAFSG